MNPQGKLNRPTILTDVDGVLADLVTNLCLELGLRGFHYTPEDFKHFDFSKSLDERATVAAYEIMSTPGFCHGLPWFEGAKDFLKGLQAIGDVCALTSPMLTATWQHERSTWLYPEVKGKDVLSVSSKHKPKVAGDFLIEDHPGTMFQWLKLNRLGVGILIDRPWNQPSAAEFEPHIRMIRCLDYETALQVISDHAVLTVTAKHSNQVSYAA